MSIHDLLNDINDGVTDNSVATEENMKTSLEGVGEVTAIVSDVRLNLAKLDAAVIDKFNTLYRRCLIRKALTKVSKVDRSVALEAMATLPVSNPVNEAKLTSTPSAINKKILDDIVFSGKDEMPADLHDYLLNTFSLFNEEFLTEVDDLIQFVTNYNDTIRTLVNNKYKTSIVMVDNETRNLLSDSLVDLSFVDDSTLMYDKYTGELNKRINAILCTELYEFNVVLKEMGKGSGKGFSVIDILSDLTLLEVILRGIRTTIAEFISVATFYVNQNNRELTGAAGDSVNALQQVIISTDNYNRINSVIGTDSVFLEALSDYVNFID